jgi:hypothetical protein
MEQNTTQFDFLIKKIQRLERIIACMSITFLCIFFIGFTHKRNDAFGNLKVERLQIVDGEDTVLDFGTSYDNNKSYKSGYISGFGTGTLGTMDKIFDIYGGSETKNGIFQLYRPRFSTSDNVITIGRYDKGGFIDFFDANGKFSKSIKAE